MSRPAGAILIFATFVTVIVLAVVVWRGRWPTVDASSDGPTALRGFFDALIEQSFAPGIQYVAVDSSGTLLSYAGGVANLHGHVPMNAGTTMMWYSVSKTITAAAVLRLVADGRVGLDDPVERYVPGVPYGPEVTIRRLLSHTSGVPSPIPLSWVHPAAQHPGFDERSALDAVLARNGRTVSTPGTRFRYSNLGYWLLGPVVEQVSGEPFAAFVTGEIIAPLGLSPEELGYAVVDPTRHATGYLEKYSFTNLAKGFLVDAKYIGRYEGPWLGINPHYVNGPAFGGLVGTATGVSRFLQDQLQPESRVLPPRARALFYEQQATSDGTLVPMTLGWHVGELGGEPYFYKEGGGAGFHSMMRLYPHRGIGTVIVSNATGFDVRKALDLADPTLFR